MSNYGKRENKVLRKAGLVTFMILVVGFVDNARA